MRQGLLALACGTGSALLAGPALAADAPKPTPAAESSAGDTLKERLSDKASDQQRVDNCKVPLEKRGPKERPDRCGNEASTTAGK